MKLMLILCLLVANVGVGGCKKDVSGTSDEEVRGTNSNLNKNLILQYVNDVRAAGCNCGSTAMPPVPPVQWNNTLETAAILHSKDMQTNNFFDHLGTGNTSPGDRIRSAGYSWKTFGENIAQGAASERAVIDGWLNSEGHCRNIMNGSYKEMGIGRAGNYWTQVFAGK